MSQTVQAEDFFSTQRSAKRRLPRVIPVAFRESDGGVGKRDHLTHWVHSYPAKMFHRIPQVILGQLPTTPKLTILDPFCGSGTVLLEAIAKGHSAIGVDVSPMARLISRVKCTPVDTLHLQKHYAGIIKRSKADHRLPKADITLDFWFRRNIRPPLEALRRSISSIQHDDCRNFYAIAFSSIIRKCSLADPSIPPPVKLSATRAIVANARYRQNLNKALKLRSPDVYTLFEIAVQQNLARMSQLCELPTIGKTKLLGMDRHAASTGLKESSVDLVITSPPYCGAQKYIRSMRLELLLLGFDTEDIADADRRTLGSERMPKKQEILPFEGNNYLSGLHSRIARVNPTRAAMFQQYICYLGQFAAELSRVLKPGGDGFVTFGTDRLAGIEVDFASIFAKQALEFGMKHVTTLVDNIPSRGLMTTRHASASTIKDERVVWIQR